MRYRQNTKGDILYGPPVRFMAKHGKRFEAIVKARIDKVKIQVSHDIVNTTAKTCYLRIYA